MVALVRAFGLHRPDGTPCGKPVSVSEAHALMELGRGAPLSQRELGERLRLEKSTVSRLVSQLEARGWAVRGPDDADGRAVRVRLTERGERAASELADARRAKFARVLASIPEEERDRVEHALGVLAEAMRADA
jgi:DNA-binding MarR family transcriptional regulator